MARGQRLDLQASGKTVARSSWLKESNIFEATVFSQPINRFTKLDVTKKTRTAATVTMKVILSAAATARKIPTPEILRLPDSEVTGVTGEHEMLLESSSALVVDQPTGLGRLIFIVYRYFCLK